MAKNTANIRRNKFLTRFHLMQPGSSLLRHNKSMKAGMKTPNIDRPSAPMRPMIPANDGSAVAISAERKRKTNKTLFTVRSKPKNFHFIDMQNHINIH